MTEKEKCQNVLDAMEKFRKAYEELVTASNQLTPGNQKFLDLNEYPFHDPLDTNYSYLEAWIDYHKEHLIES